MIFLPFHSWNIFQGERWNGDGGDDGYDLITARRAGTPTFVVHALQTFWRLHSGFRFVWNSGQSLDQTKKRSWLTIWVNHHTISLSDSDCYNPASTPSVAKKHTWWQSNVENLILKDFPHWNWHSTWKMVVGRWISLLGWPIFRGYASFRKCN